jgi:hypothetical protein
VVVGDGARRHVDRAVDAVTDVRPDQVGGDIGPPRLRLKAQQDAPPLGDLQRSRPVRGTCVRTVSGKKPTTISSTGDDEIVTSCRPVCRTVAPGDKPIWTVCEVSSSLLRTVWPSSTEVCASGADQSAAFHRCWTTSRGVSLR